MFRVPGEKCSRMKWVELFSKCASKVSRIVPPPFADNKYLSASEITHCKARSFDNDQRDWNSHIHNDLAQNWILTNFPSSTASGSPRVWTSGGSFCWNRREVCVREQSYLTPGSLMQHRFNQKWICGEEGWRQSEKWKDLSVTFPTSLVTCDPPVIHINFRIQGLSRKTSTFPPQLLKATFPASRS